MAAMAMKLEKIAAINPVMIIGAVAFSIIGLISSRRNFKIFFMLFYNLVNYKQLLYQMTNKTY
jgi:hypothetical protein